MMNITSQIDDVPGAVSSIVPTIEFPSIVLKLCVPFVLVYNY